jgi:ferrous iron transport protein A
MKMEIALTKLKCKKLAVIKRLEGGLEFQRKISDLGIRIGKHVQVVSCQPFKGPLVIKIDSMRIALGRGMASKIIVELK